MSYNYSTIKRIIETRDDIKINSVTNEGCQISFKSVVETVWPSCLWSIRFAARTQNQVSKTTQLIISIPT